MEKALGPSYFVTMFPAPKHPDLHWPLALFCLLFVFSGCKKAQENTASGSEPITLNYAQGFQIFRGAGYWEVAVTQPWTGADVTYRYLVLESDAEKPNGQFDAILELDAQRIILTSTTQVPHLDFLNITERLIGFPNTDLISSEKARERIDAGLVQDLGSAPSANPELVLELNPDLMMISTLGDDLQHLELFQNAGIPVVINGEYVEQHPLGRAEWIKFTGVLTGKFEEAQAVFDQIESDYLQALDLAQESDSSKRPTVLSGVMYKDIWYAPGQDSWGARILENAGGRYVFAENKGEGSLQLNYEYVLEKALGADFWIGSADFESLQQMGQVEPRYQAFEAFQTGRVYSYTQKKGATGGLEYFELGYLRPDLILKDMIKILHPELLPDYELYFYQKLDEK
ncbi:ABC transporter substrate-binding protein [Algoriphagus namhaensis]